MARLEVAQQDLTQHRASPGELAQRNHAHGTVREGVIAGVIAGTAVALYFLVVDAIAGRLLYTPSVLGGAITTILWPAENPSPLQNVILFTIIHYLAFAALGIAATAMIHGSAQHPPMLAGLMILFVAFEVAFYGFTYFVSLWAPMQEVSWYHAAIANLIAAFLMGQYLWRRHPEISGRLDEVLQGK